MPAILSSDKERKEDRMNPKMRRSLLEFEAIFVASTSIVHTMGWGRAVPIYSGIGSCHKFCSSERGKNGSVYDIVH